MTATPASRRTQPQALGHRVAPGSRGTQGHGVAYLAAVLAVFGWGSLYTVAKPALLEVSPLMVALARAGLACLTLTAIVCLRERGLLAGLRHLRAEATTSTRDVAMLGLISFACTSILAMTAQQFLPASVNGLLNNLSPLFISLFVAMSGRARSGPLLIAGSALAAVGVTAVLLGDTLLASVFGAEPAPLSGSASPVGGTAVPADGASLALGTLIAITGSALIAVSNLVTRRVVAGRDALAVAAVAAGWGTLPLLLLITFGWGGTLGGFMAASMETKARLVWLGTISTAFNFSLWFFALSRLPVTRVANFQYLIPPLGVLIALAVLHEPAGAGLALGTLAIVGGIAVAQRGAERAG